MLVITLNEEQSRLYHQGIETLEVRDSDGKILTRVHSPKEAEAIALALSRKGSKGPCLTGAQVQARLQALQVAADKEGLSADELRALHRRLREEDRQ